jgi:LytS/YehU family sensor histidine kinase
MCKLATESASRQPKAYMYSILFMMSMPMMISTGFGIAFYRLNRQAIRMREEELRAFQEANETAPENESN